MVERAGRETPILGVAGSKPIRSKVLLIRDLFLPFLLHFINLLLYCVSASVCKAQLRLSVKIKN